MDSERSMGTILLEFKGKQQVRQVVYILSATRTMEMEKRNQEGDTGQRVSNGGQCSVMAAASSYMVKARSLLRKSEEAQSDRKKSCLGFSHYPRQRGRKEERGKKKIKGGQTY